MVAEKRCGTSKWYVAFYVKPFRFVHNPFHYGPDGRLVAKLAMALDQFEGRQARPQGGPRDDTRLAAIFR